MKPHVGVLREGPLHAALKDWYRREGDRVEVPVDTFVIDIVRDDLLVEIQTGSFSKIVGKLEKLLETHPVRLVHPVIAERVIARIDDDGQLLSRRRSPKRGSLVDVFAELVSRPGLMAHPRFGLEVVRVRAEEVRRFEPGRSWRRKGWVVAERRLLEVVDSVRLEHPADLRALMPPALPDPFNTADVAQAWGRDRRLAQQALYCLRTLDQVRVGGRVGNTRQYRWCDPGPGEVRG